MDMGKNDKLVELIRKHLKEELGREPTAQELASHLPLFVCKSL